MVDQEDSDSCTVFVGNLEPNATEEILFELFLQAGPVKSVKIPKDYRTGRQQRFGFVLFKHKVSVSYAIKLLNGIKLFDTPLNLNIKQKNKNSQDGLSEQNNNGEQYTPRDRERFRPSSNHFPGNGKLNDEAMLMDQRYQLPNNTPPMMMMPMNGQFFDPYGHQNNQNFNQSYTPEPRRQTYDRSRSVNRPRRSSPPRHSSRRAHAYERSRSSDHYDNARDKRQQNYQSRHEPYRRR